jgi:prepilin-type N-terminal cleavage/methylation domain-containing protein
MGNEKGFTLIELVATLVLVGIMAVGIAYFLVPGIQGYLFAQENAELTQKVELAMTRLTRELRECYTCNGDQGQIDLAPPGYSFKNTLGNRTVELMNGNLQINGYTLLDNIQSDPREILYRYSNATKPLLYDLHIEIAHLNNSDTQSFKTRIFPRNTYQ